MSRRTFAAILIAGLAGCGYTFGTGLPERGIHTVALTLVGNDSYRQRLEVDLAVALARELPISTDLRLADAADADATIEVTIVEAEEHTLVPGSRANPVPVSEGALTAAIRMRLRHRDGRVLSERVLLDRTEFRDPVGENLRSAQHELATDLARKIALALDGRAVDAGAPSGTKK